MEKSMVHELNSLTYSTVFTTRPSFISTHISDPDNNDLRRSRISNLPGYRKQDLSSKLNFVVVFQSIQIERLSQEIQTLRVKARDWQRQRNNFESYEVQIRQLTQRCHMYEVQRQGINEQQQKMKIFCEQLYRQFEQYKSKYGQIDLGLKQKYSLQRKRTQQLQGEVDKWRYRCTSMQKSKSKELQEMRLQFQAQRKSYINREIKEITIKYENQIQTIVSELRKAREEADWRINENQRLQHMVSGFDMREQEVRQIEDKMEEYENKFVMLSQENYRLNQLLRWKTEELQKLKMGEQQLRNQLETSRALESTNQSLTFQITKLTQNLQENKVSNSRSSEQIERLQLENQRMVEYQRLVDQSANQIERLNGIIHSKINELDQNKNNIKTLQTKLSSINSATQKEFASYEQKMISYSKEQERLTIQLKNRLTENQSLKGKMSEIEKGVGKSFQLEKQNKDLKDKLNYSSRQIQEFKMKIIMLEESVSIVQQLQLTLSNDQLIKSELIAQRQRLNDTIRNLTLQLETSNQKLTSLQEQCNKYTHIQVEIRQYQSRLAFMTQQLDKINAQIQIRVGELHQLRDSLKSLSNSKNIYQNIQQKLVQNMSQMQNLILSLDDSRKDNEKLQNSNMILEMSARKMQGDIIGFNEERNQMTLMIQDKTNEVGRLSSQLDGLASVASEFRVLQRNYQEKEESLESYKVNYQQLEIRLQKEFKKSQNYSNQVEQMCSQLMQLRQQPQMSAKLSEELIFMRKQCEQKTMTISFMNKRIQTIENILKTFKQKYTMQCHVSEEMRRKIQSVASKMSFVDQVLDMANRYAEELSKASEKNVMLESQKKLLDLQLCQSLKVVDVNEPQLQQPPQMMTTFGLPQTYKNSSIMNQVPYTFQARDGNVFTFKDMVQKSQGSKQVVKTEEERSYRYSQEPRSFVRPGQERAYRHQVRQESQVNSLNDARDTTSMASSYIHNLGYDSGRYQNIGVSQFQSINNPNFGKGVTVSKMRNIATNSPAQRPATSHVVSPLSSNQRNSNEVRYIAINEQIQTEGNRGYINPFDQTPRDNHPAVLESAGVRRVTSYTSFNNYPGVQGGMQPVQMTPQGYNGHQQRSQDSGALGRAVPQYSQFYEKYFRAPGGQVPQSKY